MIRKCFQPKNKAISNKNASYSGFADPSTATDANYNSADFNLQHKSNNKQKPNQTTFMTSRTTKSVTADNNNHLNMLLPKSSNNMTTSNANNTNGHQQQPRTLQYQQHMGKSQQQLLGVSQTRSGTLASQDRNQQKTVASSQQLTRPDSSGKHSKHRTSFLMNSQTQQNLSGAAGPGGANILGKQSSANARGGSFTNEGMIMALNTKKGAEMIDVNQENPPGIGYITSPPKRGGQTRKPSGKSTKSNRKALAKKQLLTNNSSIFNNNNANNTVATQKNHHQMSVNNENQITSPVLAKINAAYQQQKTIVTDRNQNLQFSASLSHQQSSQGGKDATRHHNTMIQAREQVFSAGKNSKINNTNATTTSSLTKQQASLSFSQPRQAQNTLLRNNSNSQQVLNEKKQQSTYIIQQQQIDYKRERPLSKRVGSQDNKAELNNNYAEPGAVSAVIPSQNSTTNTSAQGVNRYSMTTGSGASQQQQQSLPPIQGGNHSAKNSNNFVASQVSPYNSVEDTGSQSIPNHQLLNTNGNVLFGGAQAPTNDYFSLKNSNGQATGGQYSASGNGSQASNVMRSASQPYLHSGGNSNNQSQQQLSSQQNQMGVPIPQIPTQHSQSFLVQQNSVAMNNNNSSNAPQNQPERSSNAQQQMSSLLGKGLRAQSEPPVPLLKNSDSTASFMENLRQRATFSVVMKATIQPKQVKTTAELSKLGTEAQLASDAMKAQVTKFLQKNQTQSTLPFFQTSKVSTKAFGQVRAFAANTNVGIVRKANEDRISIILNVIQPAQKVPRIPADKWPKLQIFGVYDGHGGSKCAEYLKDNLHNNIILQPEFPSNIPEAFRKGSWKTEEDYLSVAAPSQDQPHNKAGSCAIVILVVNSDIYILNVGDSRAIGSVSQHPSDSVIHAQASYALSSNNDQNLQMEATSQVKVLSQDHKPSCPREFKRITDAGGYIYQTQTVMKNGYPTTQTQQVRQNVVPDDDDSDAEENPFVGPYRCFPGRLSVCRTFGDCEAKLAYLGGIRGVVTCEPEITHEVEGVDSLDYVLIGSDGIFDKLKNDAINQIVWDVTTQERQLALSKGEKPSVHKISGLVSDEILHACARNRSLDNISVVFVAFQRFQEYIEMTDQEYLSPMPVKQMNLNHILNSAGDKDMKSNLVTPNIKHSIANSLSGSASNSMRTSGLPKTKPILMNQFMASEQKQQYSNRNSQAVLQVNKNGAESAKGPSANYEVNQSGSQNDGQNSINHLNKIRQKEPNFIDGVLENVNRPSSRPGATRKGLRSRKSNNSMATSNQASLSQDLRPSLPDVQTSKPGSLSKLTYSKLTEVKSSTNNSASAANLHTVIKNGSGNNLSTTQTQRIAVNSQSSSNLLQTTNSNNQSSQNANIPISQKYQSSREKMQNVSNNLRGGLFKVSSQQTANSSGHSALPDFFKKGHHLSTSNAHLSGNNSINNEKQQQQQQQQSKYANNDAASLNSSRQQTATNTNTNISRKKMKPYKSGQIRRMPDNSTNQPKKFMTEQMLVTTSSTQIAKSQSREASQDVKSENVVQTLTSSQNYNKF